MAGHEHQLVARVKVLQRGDAAGAAGAAKIGERENLIKNRSPARSWSPPLVLHRQHAEGLPRSPRPKKPPCAHTVAPRAGPSYIYTS
jgi:hypothetical protein